MTGLTLYKPGKHYVTGWDFDNIITSFFDNDLFKSSQFSDIYPAVDIQESDESYFLEADLPGRSENDIEVKVEDNVLTITSVKHENEDDKKVEYHLRERRQAAFERKFIFPKDADKDNIKASFKNGLLTLEIKKRPKAAPKKIEVKLA